MKKLFHLTIATLLVTSCNTSTPSVTNDPETLKGKNTYENPADGKVYSTDGEFVEYTPENGLKEVEGPVQPASVILLTNENELDRIIGFDPLVNFLNEVDEVVQETLGAVKEKGKIVIQFNLYSNKEPKLSLAFGGEIKSEDLDKVYKEIEAFCLETRTKEDSCIFQNVYIINSYEDPEKE